jgi:hypothetical protein
VLADELVPNPDGITLYFLHTTLAHEEPFYEKLASLDREVQAADEFHRDAITQKATERMKAKVKSVADTKFLLVNLNSKFGEYDSQYKEYDFDVDDGAWIPFEAFGRAIHVNLANAGKARIWSLDPDAAAFALKKVKGNRNVVLKLKLEVIDSPAAVDNEPIVINAKIVEYDIVGGSDNARLGKVIIN